jgi:hypothetical protein
MSTLINKPRTDRLSLRGSMDSTPHLIPEESFNGEVESKHMHSVQVAIAEERLDDKAPISPPSHRNDGSKDVNYSTIPKSFHSNNHKHAMNLKTKRLAPISSPKSKGSKNF